MRFFRFGELPLVLLALLDREPLNGYELMGSLDELFSPQYTASAGSVYPALNALEAESLIQPVGDEVPKRYKLTRTGAKALIERRPKLAALERRTGTYINGDDAVEGALARLAGAARSVKARTDPTALERILQRATRQILELID